jgi:DNA integrity scanning protein DisA with diadenylate cyclase activity/mannitol/fructose-specific phosphotransferase system IIA component (Ntr-type)
MVLSDYIAKERIVFLKNRSKRGALSELVRATCGTVPGLAPEAIFEAIWAREQLVSSWVDPGLAIPHARLPGFGQFIMAVGRSKAGVEYESADGKPVHLLVMILGAAEEMGRHLLLLAETARALRSSELRLRILAARTREEVRDLVLHGKVQRRETRKEAAASLSLGLLDHALALAKQTRARAVLVDYDGLRSPGFLRRLRTDVEIILVTQGRVPISAAIAKRYRTVLTPFSGFSRGSQRSLTLLLVLSQGLLRPEDRVINLYGLPGAGTLDTLAVVDVARELPSFTPAAGAALLGDIEPQVMARVIQLAADLAREGREGRPLGTAFIVGDHEHVRGLSSQLVINPFRGYRDEEKNILDPSLEETVKEFSHIDGAFLVRGDGVIHSAGTYLRPDRSSPRLASGLGTRHAAAAGITFQTDAMAVVVSQSTGRVSVFKAGALIMALRKTKT